MAVPELFRALGDPTRLEMVQRLSGGGTFTITTVSTGLQISRQGARKHLQILADAKLVKMEPKGREMSVILQKSELKRAGQCIADLEKKWDVRLEKLKNILEQ